VKIQSLSVGVPGGCPNNCRFCVSKIHPNRGYGSVWTDYKAYKRYEREFYDRMSYCQQHGCTDVILTGDGEVHQATFRTLYTSELDTAQDRWIREHPFDPDRLTALEAAYIRENGRRLERLPFGAIKYSVRGISVVVDDDCMSGSGDKHELKYAILRTNCKLYSKWNDKGSLIF
jgi:hypothetical protein